MIIPVCVHGKDIAPRIAIPGGSRSRKQVTGIAGRPVSATGGP